MNDLLLPQQSVNLSFFGKHWGWFLLWGIIILLLGMAAIVATTSATFLTVILLGMLIGIGGIVIIIDSFTFWWHQWSGFFLHLAMGILYLIVGSLLFTKPVAASVYLTLLLGVFYTLVGIFRISYSLLVRAPQWGWNLFNGIISLLIGFLIMASWPASSLYIIGLFVGIDLLFCGWAYIIAALAGRKIVSKTI